MERGDRMCEEENPGVARERAIFFSPRLRFTGINLFGVRTKKEIRRTALDGARLCNFLLFGFKDICNLFDVCTMNFYYR